jgi:hypothetical protein
VKGSLKPLATIPAENQSRKEVSVEVGALYLLEH